MPTTEKKYEYALPVGTVIKGKNQQYRIESVLGQGGFGITYRVASTLRVGTIEVEAIFALKEHFIKGHCHRAANGLVVEYGREAAELVEKSRHDFQTEAERLTLVCEGCENIVKVSEVIEQNNTVYYVMEYLDGGDLRSLVKQRGTPLSEAETISIIIPIAKAIGFIHQHNLLHLDIKPDNIVMRRGIKGGADVPVLIDFGIAKHFDKKGTPTSQINAKGATLGYSPIEQYDMISHFAPEIDVYALAATTFYLLTATDPDSAFNLKAELISQKLPDNLSDRTRQAVIQGMAKLSENRTPSPQAFIKNLRERYSLPINYVLRGQESKYRIIGVKGESDSHLLYSASIDTGEDIAANSPQQTAIVNYDIYELFDSNNSRRKKDESVTDTSQAAIKQFEAMLKRNFNYDFNSPTHLRDTALAYEYFNANGTIYYSFGWSGEKTKYTEGDEIVLPKGEYEFYTYTRCVTEADDSETDYMQSYGNNHRYYYVYDQPTFSVEDGTYNDDVNVKIENLPNTNSAQVYYYFYDETQEPEDEEGVLYHADDVITMTESKILKAYIVVEGDSGKKYRTEPVEAEYTIIAKTQLNISYAQNSREWASYCASENSLETPDGLQAYVVKQATKMGVQVEAIDYIPQGVGVLLKRTAEVAEPIVAKAYIGNEPETPANKLVGTTTSTSVKTLTGSVYVLYNDGFTRATSGSIGANRGYLLFDETVAAGARLSIFEDETTAVENVNRETLTNNQYYNLNGQRVVAPKKNGLYIVNGQKKIVK